MALDSKSFHLFPFSHCVVKKTAVLQAQIKIIQSTLFCRCCKLIVWVTCVPLWKKIIYTWSHFRLRLCPDNQEYHLLQNILYIKIIYYTIKMFYVNCWIKHFFFYLRKRKGKYKMLIYMLKLLQPNQQYTTILCNKYFIPFRFCWI